ncbi:endoplasmic reticulum oxidoreductins 1 [Euphorbia peplus]|nr:endoplasmic reticulum oxidoreductins 1 [Euphorbia peplus]
MKLLQDLKLALVKLWCDFPFWPDVMCHLRDCSVCECPENEFLESLKIPLRRSLSSDNYICQGKPEAAVDRTLDSKAFMGWQVLTLDSKPEASFNPSAKF